MTEKKQLPHMVEEPSFVRLLGAYLDAHKVHLHFRRTPSLDRVARSADSFTTLVSVTLAQTLHTQINSDQRGYSLRIPDLITSFI